MGYLVYGLIGYLVDIVLVLSILIEVLYLTNDCMKPALRL